MEEFLLTVAVVLGIALIILPIITFFLVVGARRRIRTLELENDEKQAKLTWLYEQLKERPAVAARAETPAAVEEPESLDETQPSPPASADADTLIPTGPATPPTAGAPTEGAPPDEQEIPAAAREEAPPPPPKKPAEPKMALEQRLAHWFTRIGAGALLLGALYFFKYAVDSEWIGPMGRVLIGALGGIGMLVAAEIARTRARPTFVQVLVGIGLALLFISSYASSAFYGLVSIEISFSANILILMVGALLAWRHESEAILVLVTLAGFANPVLLSTGTDRPVALFAYLLLIGAVVLAVAALKKLPITIGVTILGTAAIFLGWHDKYFLIFDHRADAYIGDVPPEQLVGAYHSLQARIAPLVFVALAALEWIGVAIISKRRQTLTWIVPLVATAALLLWHGGVTAILPDQTVPLGVVMIIVGVSSVLIMRYLEQTKLLVVPMLLAFLLLAGGTGANREGASPYLLALLGIWSGVYVVAFLYDALRAGRTIALKEAIPAALALDAFIVLALIVTIPDGYRTAAIAATASAGVGALVAYRAERSGLMLSSILVSFFALGVANVAFVEARNDVRYFDAVLILIDTVWAFGLTALALRLANKNAYGKLTLVTAAVATLGGLTLVLTSTTEHVPTLRALLTAMFGTASLGAATFLAKRDDAHLYVTVYSAIALSLFAAAAGFGLSGATITLAWAVLFIVTAIIFSRAQEATWLVAAALLGFAVLLRIVAVDLPQAEAAVALFMQTNGREGNLSIPVLFNTRAYGLVAGGVAALAAAFVIRRAAAVESATISVQTRGVIAAALAVGGYALLTALAISEVRSALTTLPAPPPVGLDYEEFSAFMEQVYQARANQAGMLDVATTVVLAIVGTLLLFGGFLMKDAFHRYLGLIVFIGTIGKLATYDVWNLPRLYQVVVLTFVGGLLVAAGFLYARLKGLFAPGASAALLLILLIPGMARAEPEAPPKIEAYRFRSKAPITGVDAVGYYAFAVPPELYERSTAELADVRITAGAVLVPHVLQDIPADRPARWVPARMYDPGDLPEGGYRATFELSEDFEHCEVELQLRGDGAFLRRTRIETGPAPDDFQTVSEGAVVYALESDGTRYEGRTVRYPSSLGRFVRISLLPDPDAERTEIRSAKFACITPDAVNPRLEIKLAVTKIERDDTGRNTLVFLDAGRRGMPVDSIALKIGTKEFVRRVEIGASDYEQVWPVVGSGVINRVARTDVESGNVSTLSIRPTKKRYFRLKITDGDNAPLAIESATGTYRAQRIVFSTQTAGAHALYVGWPEATAPYYDLTDVLREKDGLSLELGDASMGALADNPDFGADPTIQLPWTEQHRGAISIALIVLLLGLAGWAVKLFVRR